MTFLTTSGAVHLVVFVLTLSGIWAQIAKVISRRSGVDVEHATVGICTGYIFWQFTVFALFGVYGLICHELNLVLFASRTLAAASALLLLVLIAARSGGKREVFASVCAVAILVFFALVFSRPAFVEFLKLHVPYFRIILSVASCLLVTSLYWQHQKLITSRRWGGVSKTSHRLFFLKDLSAIVFGLAMGLEEGWPLILSNSGLAIVRAKLLNSDYRE